MINSDKSTADLDLAYLREMSGDSPDFMIEMLDTMMVQIPIYLADLQGAVDAKSWKLASEFAHKVKPTFYYVGRDDMRDYMQQIERNCKESINLDKVPSALDEINEEMKRLLVQIEETKQRLAQLL